MWTKHHQFSLVRDYVQTEQPSNQGLKGFEILSLISVVNYSCYLLLWWEHVQ